MATSTEPCPKKPDLSQLDWEGDLYPCLLVATIGRLKRARFRGQRVGPMSGVRTPHDFIHTAIEKLMDGRRNWNHDRTGFDNVWAVVSSEISNWLTSPDSTKSQSLDDPSSKVISLRLEAPSQEETLHWKTQKVRLLEFLQARDPEAAQLASLMLLEEHSHRELASKLNIDEGAIPTIKRRLRRLVVAYQDENK